jgi:hypothetical protein
MTRDPKSVTSAFADLAGVVDHFDLAGIRRQARHRLPVADDEIVGFELVGGHPIS